MKTLLTLFTVLALCTLPRELHAQQPVTGITFLGQTGNGASLTASIAGAQGTTTAFYVLMANFTGGSIPSNIVTVTNTPNTLNSTNFVSFVWLPVSGVVSYDLLKLTSASLPTGSNSVGLHLTLSATTTGSTDQGSGLSSYTITAPPANVQGTLTLNARDHTVPQFEFDGAGSALPGIALNTKALSVENIKRVKTDATTTGVTLAALNMVNGVYLHAPTGAVNDTTDTAAAIVAALPNCQIGSANGASTGFTFSLINNSAGAHVITILPGVGVTLTSSVSPLTLAQNTLQNFVGIVTNCATPAVTLFSIGQALVF